MTRLGLAALVALMLLPGCAAVTGVATGAFTGAVDLPAETYRVHRETFHRYPYLFGLNVFFVGPVGFAGGPVAGLIKGASLDVQCAIELMDYHEVFHTYRPASIWRPWTFYWPVKAATQENSKGKEAAPPAK